MGASKPENISGKFYGLAVTLAVVLIAIYAEANNSMLRDKLTILNAQLGELNRQVDANRVRLEQCAQINAVQAEILRRYEKLYSD